jgi:hypothetical protein
MFGTIPQLDILPDGCANRSEIGDCIRAVDRSDLSLVQLESG